MLVVADASVLVAELLRQRGWALLAHPRLRVVVAQDQWDESEHELARRLALIIEQGRITAEQARALGEAITALVEDRVIEIIPRAVYEHLEATARRRVPRDPKDWAPVALALALDAAIFTGDGDFSVAACRPGPWTRSAPNWPAQTRIPHRRKPTRTRSEHHELRREPSTD